MILLNAAISPLRRKNAPSVEMTGRTAQSAGLRLI